MDHVALVTWPAVAVGLTVWLFAVGLPARRATRRSTHPPLLALRVAMWSLTTTAALALVVHATGLVPVEVPHWFYVVAVIPFIGPALALVSGATLGRAARVGAIAALPLGIVAGGLVINQHYQYWPTLAALAGKDHVDPVVDVPDGRPIDDHLVAAEHHRVADRTGRRGVLVDVEIPGTVSGFKAREARIWLPPAYAEHPERKRPVIELVGGSPSWTSDWTRAAGLDVLADRLATQHDGEAPLIVMVDANGTAFGDTECVDSTRGHSETYLTQDVPTFVIDHFGASANAASWGVAGYSMGGTCATMLALHHPDRYAAFADLAGDARPDVGGTRRTLRTLFAGSQTAFDDHDPTQLLAQRPAPAVAAYFAYGRSDGAPRTETMRLADTARASGLSVEERSYRGGHDFGFVHRALGGALDWFYGRLVTTA